MDKEIMEGLQKEAEELYPYGERTGFAYTENDRLLYMRQAYLAAATKYAAIVEQRDERIKELLALMEELVREKDYNFLVSQDSHDTNEIIHKSGDEAWQQFKSEHKL